jgi:hypothetical protein
MRIYAIADIHGRDDREKRAIEFASSSDLAIVCGDITHFGPPQRARDFLDRIADKVETFAIPGNCDLWETVDEIKNSKAKSLHAEMIDFKGRTFFGFGGAVPGMIKTVFENAEETVYEELSKVAVERGIMVTHMPPRGHLDHTVHGSDIGSTSVLRVIEEKNPILDICGHVHEGVGTEVFGGTTIVNCSAGYRGYGCYIDIEDDVRVGFLE